VSGRHVDSCCLVYALKGASSACGRRLSGLSSPRCLRAQRPSIYSVVWSALTDVVRVPKLGLPAANADVLIAVSRRTLAIPPAG
jgi:hypothetical protein